MSKKHVTFGGLGQHEFYMPTTGRGHQNRRDRKKCEYYFPEKGYCTKIRNFCVGPTVCMKYKAKASERKVNKKKHDVGMVVYHQVRGEGKIVTISYDVCTVEFATGKKIAFKYPESLKNGILTRRQK